MYNTISMAIVRIVMTLALAASMLYGDVIYLSDGNVLVVTKAWEEGDTVKYETSKGIGILPRSSVQEIRHEKPIAAPGATRWVLVNPADSGHRAGQNTAALPEPSSNSGAAGVSEQGLTRLRENWNADPSDEHARLELAHALNSTASMHVAQGNLAAAQKNLEEAVQLDERNPILLLNLAAIFFRSGNYAKTEDLLLSCLQIDGKDQRTYLFLGETYYMQEKISKAISTWNEGLKLGPSPAIAERLEKANRESSVHEELRELKSTHFVLKYDRQGSSIPLGEQILAALEDSYRLLSTDLTARAPETVAVILYPDQDYFDVTQAAAWTGGLFDGKIRIPVRGVFSVNSDLKSVLIHELAHCFMNALPGRGSPVWFQEGVAQLLENSPPAENVRRLAQVRKAKRLIPLGQLRDSFMRLSSDQVGVAYIESLSAVQYLVARFGRSSLHNIVELLGQNYRFENALKAAANVTVSEFEAAWETDGLR